MFVNFDLEFDLKFEISDGKNMVIFGGGGDFSTCHESAKHFGANFGANFGNFANFVTFSETSFSRRAVIK